jgi:hypothetical protein
MKPLLPCPECGGERIIFHCDPGSGYNLNIPLPGGYMPTGIPLYACIWDHSMKWGKTDAKLEKWVY